MPERFQLNIRQRSRILQDPGNNLDGGNQPLSILSLLEVRNQFLHANAVREKWPAGVPLERSLREARVDTVLSVGLGGLITLAILSTAAAAFFQSGLTFGGDSMARQLEPLLGPSARYVFAGPVEAAACADERADCLGPERLGLGLAFEQGEYAIYEVEQ